MSQYLTFLGSEALSEFRDGNSRTRLIVMKSGQNTCTTLLSSIHQLLTYGDQVVEDEAEGDDIATTLFVYTRIPTISPWSSKATSNAKLCGFELVQRTEQGTIIKIRSKAV